VRTFDDEAVALGGLAGRFDLRGRIGAGAFGQVFKAFDRQHGRLVSVRVTPSMGGFGSLVMVLYQKLQEILARLGHRAILPILEVESSDKMLRIVTPLVEGQTLDQRLRASGRLDPRAAAALVAELAEALELAHQQGLVHGDITPSNILLGDDGHPRLLGFTQTALGSADAGVPNLVGTPGYMAPERLQATTAHGDPRSDVYSLGALLYEILTGQPPFRGTGLADLLPQILKQPPTPPRRVVRSIPAELETICLKAMAKSPDQRYQTAGELAAALGAFLKPRRRQGFWK
jgi:serine/threonine protein kinase